MSIILNVVALNKYNQPIPEILKDENELVYQFDVDALLKLTPTKKSDENII